MNSVLLVIAVLLGLATQIIAGGDGKHSWDYGRRGPDVWRHDFKTCAGIRQSPINIEPNNVVYDKSLKPFLFVNYDRGFRWNVTHNGHTVVAHKLDGSDVLIRGSDFDEDYTLLQFHFHWGYNDYQGSEHLISREKFPLEMHLVHQSNSGKLAVLGVLFQLSKDDNPALNSLLNAIMFTSDSKNWRELTMSLNSILPNTSQLDSYYRYAGSLTTPPCTEGVTWNIFKTYVEISQHQLLSFRTNNVRANYREPQEIFNRQVTSSFQPTRTLSGKVSSDQSTISHASKLTANSGWSAMFVSIITAMVILKNELI